MKISSRTTTITAIFLLLLMFFMAVFSMKDDSITSDEVPHIFASYSYLSQREYRLNPEHPPLIKDLSAIPLLFLNLNFPKDYSTDFGQYISGWDFLHRLGNNAEQILFWSRLPMVLVLVFLGWFLFCWTKELAGNFSALLVLFLFSFSPTFLAHGRLVTFDVGTTLGFVLAIYFFLKFLKDPTRKNTIFSGLALAVALLIKFFNLLLIPFFGIIFLIFIFLKFKSKKILLPALKDYFKKIVFIGLIAIFCIWLVYQFHFLNYPLEKQLEDARFTLSRRSLSDFLNDICLWMIEKPFLRVFAHYFFGILIIYGKAGSIVPWPTYLFGMITNQGFWYYFPLVYLIKVPLAFHILTLIAFFFFFRSLRKISLKKWIESHFEELSMFAFIITYLVIAMRSKSQIGIRHILPIFPFAYILVSIRIQNWIEKIKLIPLKKIAISLVLFLLAWYGASSLSSFPHYIPYFNELVGGSKSGYEYVVDSNVDWGQGLKRLSKWVENQGIEKIYVDYFPDMFPSERSILKYYLGDKAIPWYGSCWWRWWGLPDPGSFPKGNYLAVSATFLQTDRGVPRSDYLGWKWGCYNWLNDYDPIAQVGNSIFVYYIYD